MDLGYNCWLYLGVLCWQKYKVVSGKIVIEYAKTPILVNLVPGTEKSYHNSANCLLFYFLFIFAPSQCDQIGLFWKVLGDEFSDTSKPNIW